MSRPFEVWRDPEGLAAVLRELGTADAVAITMTAELSDAFRTKREGVAFVLDAAEEVFGDPRVLTTAGALISVDAARARPWDVAAANWVATALAVAGEHPDALLIDVGSTTADVIPIAGGRIAASGRNDLERLLAAFVYTGVVRTNLAAIAPRVPLRGGWCPVASELFAISADVHLVLGHLELVRLPDTPTAGRPRSNSLASGSPGWCAPTSTSSAKRRSTRSRLTSKASRCARSRRRRAGWAQDGPVVAAGSGAFLAREVAARLGRAVVADAVGPAAALAALLAASLC